MLLPAFAYIMTNMYPSLQGKVGILTGGTSGFGYAMTRALINQGTKLAVFSVDELPDASRAELEAIGKGAFVYSTKDIMAQGASEAMVAETVERFGQLDFVIVNAGFAIRFEESLLTLPLDKLVASMRTQFEVFPIAFATLALAAARVMAPRYATVKPDDSGHRPDSGAIVVTLSETSLCPLRDDLLAYAAAKRASLSVMESLAATLGPQNIRVNCICPGDTDTPMLRQEADQLGRPIGTFLAEAAHRPLGRIGTPEDIAQAALFLASPASAFVTGIALVVDGGGLAG